MMPIFFLLWSALFYHNEAGKYICQNGTIQFRSDAPLELIRASSNELKGVIDTDANTFAFTINNKDFMGFNSPLQREHFNENYIESLKYPKSTFTGKIIEKIDYQVPGKYTVRAKGNLTIHGVTQERIIKSQLEIKGDKLFVNAAFSVLLADHNISIPRIVQQKIANEIDVQVTGEFVK